MGLGVDLCVVFFDTLPLGQATIPLEYFFMISLSSAAASTGSGRLFTEPLGHGDFHALTKLSVRLHTNNKAPANSKYAIFHETMDIWSQVVET